VPPEAWSLPDDAWIQEAQRRSIAYDEGRMTARPWPEVKTDAHDPEGRM